MKAGDGCSSLLLFFSAATGRSFHPFRALLQSWARPNHTSHRSLSICVSLALSAQPQDPLSLGEYVKGKLGDAFERSSTIVSEEEVHRR